MLVEDDNNLREIYGARLMAEGYEIVSAADGEEALALAVKEKPDLIISDVMMPKISGFDMLDILRTTAETKNTKIIMMTALSQPEDRQRGESLGADKYLVKSQVTLEDVVVAVHDILGDGSVGANPPTATPPPADPAAPTPPAQPPTGPSAPGGGTTPADNPLPKAEGASDAPEPASRKKLVIQPINDLTSDNSRLLELAAQEDAREHQLEAVSAQATEQKAIDETQAKAALELAKEVAETPILPPQSPESPSADAGAKPTKDRSRVDPTKLAEEKRALEQEIAAVEQSGVIEREAAQTLADQIGMPPTSQFAPPPPAPPEPAVAPAPPDDNIIADEAAAEELLAKAQKSATPSTKPTPDEKTPAPALESAPLDKPPTPPPQNLPKPSPPPAPPAPPAPQIAPPAAPEHFDANDISL